MQAPAMHRSGRRNSTDSEWASKNVLSAPVRSPTMTTSGSGCRPALQCSWVSGRAAMNLAPNAFQRAKLLVTEQRARVVVPAQHREPRADDVVEQDVLRSRVSTRGWMNSVPVRRTRAAAAWLDVHDGALVVAGHRLEPHLQHVALERRHDRRRANHPVAQARNAAVGRRDDPTDHGRQVDHGAGVLAPLDVVGVQQRVAGLSVDHRGQLPAEVGRVADAAVVALALPHRHQVRGVAGQQHAALAERAGDAGVVGVHPVPDDVDPVRVRHEARQQLRDERGIARPVRRFRRRGS